MISAPVQRSLPLSNRSPEVGLCVHDDAEDRAAAGHVQIAVLLFTPAAPGAPGPPAGRSHCPRLLGRVSGEQSHQALHQLVRAESVRRQTP